MKTMPVEMFIPPWLRGVDPAEMARLHATGLEIGQRAAAQQAETMIQLQKMQLAQAEEARRVQQAQQEVELETQKQQRLSQQFQQEMDLKREVEQQKAAQSAMRFAGGRMYQDTFNQLTAEGAAPDEAHRQAMLRSLPLMMGTAPGQAIGAMRQMLPVPPPREQTFKEGIPPAVIDPRGIPHWPPASAMAGEEVPFGETYPVRDESGKTLGFVARTSKGGGVLMKPTGREQFQTVAQRLELQDLYRQQSENRKLLNETRQQMSMLDPKRKGYKAMQERVDRLESDQQRIKKEIQDALAGASTTPSPAETRTTRTRIRHKESGRQGWYPGPADEVPAEYEIIGEETE